MSELFTRNTAVKNVSAIYHHLLDKIHVVLLMYEELLTLSSSKSITLDL